MQVWYLVVTVIGVATIIHWSTAIWTRYRIWRLHRMRKQRARAVGDPVLTMQPKAENPQRQFVGSGELARAQRPIGTTVSTAPHDPGEMSLSCWSLSRQILAEYRKRFLPFRALYGCDAPSLCHGLSDICGETE